VMDPILYPTLPRYSIHQSFNAKRARNWNTEQNSPRRTENTIRINSYSYSPPSAPLPPPPPPHLRLFIDLIINNKSNIS